MSTLTVTLPKGASVVDGKQLTFVAPCDCTGVTGIIIGETTYTLVDATNTCVSDKGNQFVSGAMVSVIMDTTNSRAYIQNSANSVIADDTLDSKSANAVSNKCVSAALNTKLNLAGGKLTGALTLANDPGSDMEASTKKYVDQSIINAGGFIASSTPPERTNLLWIDTTDNTMKYHDGNSWTAVYGVFG